MAQADVFFIDGCGRCALGSTPACKVNKWHQELQLLRSIVLECPLSEELKWGFPCYTFEGKNIILMGAFKEYCSLSFFKGALLKDAKGVLKKPGENSQAVRMLKFTDAKQILPLQSLIKSYIKEAIANEKSGLKIDFKSKSALQLPEELQKKMDEIPAFKSAFNALTPGRQRAYVLYFSAPKQTKTREVRIEKYMKPILNGKGMHD